MIHFNSSVYGSGAISAKKLGIPITWHIRELAEVNFSLEFFNRSHSFELINSSSKVITISNFMKNHVSKDINEDLIEVVYNGVVPLISKFKTSSDIQSLIMIGAVAPDKGQIDAIKAVEYLSSTMNIRLPLIIVGPVTDEIYYNNLLSNISDDIKELVKFVGYKKDVSEYRQTSNIALVCSKAEAFGRVTIEGMNQNQIVIGANSGATPEIIDDNLNGFLYNQGDYINLANTIIKILDLSVEQKNKIIDEATKKVKSKFDIKYTVSEVEKIMLEIIEANVGDN